MTSDIFTEVSSIVGGTIEEPPAKRVIFKYPAHNAAALAAHQGGACQCDGSCGKTFDLSVPSGAAIVHVDISPNLGAFIWAVVDPDAEPETRRFAWVKTGEPLPLDFLAHHHTHVQHAHPLAAALSGGEVKDYVTHLVELTPPPTT